jgi:hypothetical protein
VRKLKMQRFFNLFFFAGIALSFVIPVIFYKAFNSSKSVAIPTSNSSLDGIIYHIDECNIEKNKVFVRGWATPITGYGQNLVYAKTQKKSYILRTSIQERQDVSAVMKKTGVYDKSGYISSLALPDDERVLKIFIITKEGDKIYSVETNCGK